MTPTVAIFIPTFQRAHLIDKVIDNINVNTTGKYTIYFVAEQTDTDTIASIKRSNAMLILNEQEMCYAGAINTAYRHVRDTYFFTGADDLHFHEGWLENAISHMGRGIAVVGTNDMGTIPIGKDRDATHYLIKREYIKEEGGRMDMKDTVLYPYNHNYTDKEFIETAKIRGVYQYCPESLTEHMHWAWGKAKMDETYRKGFVVNTQDRNMFQQRQHLWQT